MIILIINKLKFFIEKFHSRKSTVEEFINCVETIKTNKLLDFLLCTFYFLMRKDKKYKINKISCDGGDVEAYNLVATEYK